MLITALFIVCLLVQMVFAALFVRKARSIYKALPPAVTLQPFSIIICAHNEAGNLRGNLPTLLSLSYMAHGMDACEIIVIDDGSDDETSVVLQTLGKQYANLRWTSIAKGGKKAALLHAVSLARNNHLLFTDADCSPASSKWATEMCSPLNNGFDIVLGYGGYRQVPRSVLNRFIQWETMHTWLQYSSYARMGLPYMAVGRNMACTRTVALEAMKHPDWNLLPYGDDDMLVAVASPYTKIAVVATPGSYTLSTAKDSWESWTRQKQRHLSTGKYYRRATRLALGAYALSHAGVWLGLLYFSVAGIFPAMVALAVLPLLLQWWVIRKAGHNFSNRIPLWQWAIGSVAWVTYNFAFLPFIAWKNKTSWT